MVLPQHEVDDDEAVRPLIPSPPSSSWDDDVECYSNTSTEETASSYSSSSEEGGDVFVGPLDRQDEDEECLPLIEVPLACDGGGEPSSCCDDTTTCRDEQQQALHDDTTTTSSQCPLELLGYDLSHLSTKIQYLTCATLGISFTVVYGYLQEMLSVHILGRELPLFFSACQFGMYATGAYYLKIMGGLSSSSTNNGGRHRGGQQQQGGGGCGRGGGVPMRYIAGLAFLRAIDMGCTNTAMMFLNYPAKTLLKSSRVIFTMMMGVVIGRKRYTVRDYTTVGLLVFGLLIFFDADSKVDSAYFHPLGVALLILSLLCDGAVANYSEKLMNQYKVGQDEFLFQLYSLSFILLFMASQHKGEFWEGVRFLLLPGTMEERRSVVSSIIIEEGSSSDDYSWTPTAKLMALLLFGTSGVLGSSCASAITKHFGALANSLTSTVRKALTLFLSFVLFPNQCTTEHIVGMTVFVGSLILKSLNSGGGVGTTNNNNGGIKTHDSSSSLLLSSSNNPKDGNDDGGGAMMVGVVAAKKRKRSCSPPISSSSSSGIRTRGILFFGVGGSSSPSTTTTGLTNRFALAQKSSSDAALDGDDEESCVIELR